MTEAAAAVRRGLPLRLAAERYEVPFGTLCKHYKEEKVEVGGGAKPELMEKDENAIGEYLRVCALHGEGLTKSETLVLVKEYVATEKLQTRWGENGPGEEWFRGFLKRNPKLRIRKGEAMTSQRIRGTDPFVIKKFYDDLKEHYKTEKIGPEDGGLLYNCDETALVVSQKGIKRVSRNIAGSGKSNTTVLACGGADGTKLPPFIIFTGKQWWTTWIPKHDIPGTGYASQVNGWMDGELFVKWFKEIFVPNIPSKETREKKVILFFDGVSFHISYKLIKLAQENDVVLVKFPPNVSHFIQPPDKTVFKTMKTDWNKLLIDYTRQNPGKVLPKVDFAKNIKILWEESFKPRNMASGFISTGLFPLDFGKFPEESYDPVKFQRFAKNQNNSIPSSSSTNVQKIPTPASPSDLAVAGPSGMAVAVDADKDDVDISDPEISSEITETPQETGSFELFIRTKLSATVKEVARQSTSGGKRKKISQGEGEILTSTTVAKRVKEQEDAKKKQTARNFKKPKTKAVKIPSTDRVRKDSDDEETSEEELDPKVLCSDDDIDFDTDPLSDEENEVQTITVIPERYYAVYYDSQWYLGRIIKVYATNCEIKFLESFLDSYKWPSHDDIQFVNKEFIFYGPVPLLGNGTFTIRRSDALNIKKLYGQQKKEATRST